MADGLPRESIGHYTGLGQRILELNPNILVRDAIRMVLVFTSEAPPPPKVYKSPSTSADEALYYSTIYPNSRELGTAE